MSSSITTVTHFRYGLRAHFFAEHVKEEEKVRHWLGENLIPRLEEQFPQLKIEESRRNLL